MGDFLQKLREQMTRIWDSLPMQQKIMLIGGPSILLIAMIVAVYFVSKPQMVTLLSSTDQTQLDQVITYLEGQGIEYQLEGNSILVSSDTKDRAAIQLAGAGIIGFRAGDGYELFDQVRLGMTKRMFDVNYIRAKQNELANAIVNGARNIEWAHVELNIPQEALFKEDQVEPSAMVKVVIRGGISAQEVIGIQRLVAFAVERMRPEKVVVVDGNNRVLSEDSEQEPGVAQAKKHRELEQQVENEIISDLEKHLTQYIGPTGFVVTVLLKCDWEKKHIKNIHLDATNPATVSAKNYTETTEEQGIAGEPGVSSNVQDTGIGSEPGTSKTSIEETIENFAHPWFETLIETEQGELQEIAVSVMVNYTKDEEGNPTPRDAQVITELEDILRNAAALPSFDTSKYSFVLKQLPFDDTYERELAREQFWNNVMTIVRSLIPLVLLFALGYFAYMFFQRAFRAAEVEEEVEEEEVPIEPVTEAKELTLSQLGLSEFGDIASLPAEEQRRLKMQEHVINYAAEKPEEVAGIIKAWLSG